MGCPSLAKLLRMWTLTPYESSGYIAVESPIRVERVRNFIVRTFARGSAEYGKLKRLVDDRRR